MGSVDMKFKVPLPITWKCSTHRRTSARPFLQWASWRRSKEDQDGTINGMKRSLFSLGVTRGLLPGARPEEGPETGGQ